MEFTTILHDRLTQRQKEANDYEWYKERMRVIDAKASTSITVNNVDEVTRMKVNYDLYNNIVNMRDFDYVAKPFGEGLGELPAQLTNRDIVSSKLKVIHGLEMKRPFGWKVLAVNEEATTRKETAEFELISQFVTNSIMTPIKQEIELKYQQQQNGKPLTPEEQQRIQQQIAQELDAKTPDEVRKYMKRKHQDPAEALMHQILEYLIKKEKVIYKFNRGWKHSTLSGKEVYYIGIMNGEPCMRVVNPLRFRHDETKDEDDFIEKSSWAKAEYRMTRDQIVNIFHDVMTNDQIDEIFNGGVGMGMSISVDSLFNFNNFVEDDDIDTIQVVHYEFISLRKVGFVTYLDENGEEQEDMVSENYKLSKESGDLKIEWDYIPEVHEGWRVGADMYFYLQPIPGQHKDLDNLHDPKLSYHGISYDNMNSECTAIMDRVKGYQYIYNIIMYRIELLMASDKGKLLLMNIKAIPKSMGIDIDKWTYFLEAMKIGWVNPSEEGLKLGDVTNLAKEIDMSLVSDIQKYIQLAEYIENRAGASIGVTRQMEGELNSSDAVTNTKQSLIQGNTMLEPYFDLHNQVKQNALESLCEKAKIAWSTGKQRKLSYVLDDMSVHMLTVDQKLLDGSTYGLFVLNSSKAADAKQLVEQLAHAAMQNQMIEMSDVIKVVRSEGIQEAEELLEVSEDKKHERDLKQQTAQTEAQAAEAEKARQFVRETWADEDHKIVLKEEERRKTVLQQSAIAALGFAEDKDMDKDGVPDVLEVYKHGLNAMITQGKIDQMQADTALKERQFQHQKEMDNKELEIKRIAANKKKS